MEEYKNFLYKHQQEAILEVSKHKKCLVNMWCGVGKTRTFTISLFIDKEDINVIVFPSLCLINQYLLISEPYKRWYNEETKENKLYKILEEHNFKIYNFIEKKFLFIEARK